MQKDVEVITVTTGDPRVWMSALETGKVDALAAAWDPTVSTVVGNGVGFLLLDIRNPAVHDQFVGGDVQVLGVVATETTIKEQPQLVRRFQRAVDRALQHIRSATPDELANDVAASGFVALDKAALTRTIAAMKPNYQPDGSASRQGYERAMQMYLDAGYLKAPIPFESVYSNIAK
jgi:ABC-type nitrate/sulfonate/bicarbonate transport system substrate-binding protein